MARGIVIAFIISMLWILVQIALMHIKPARRRFRAMLLGYLLSMPLVYAAYCWMPLPFLVTDISSQEAWSMGLFHAFFFHLLLFLLYVECFYHIERSVTLRLLVEIMKHPDTGPTIEDMRHKYDVREMILRRLDVLRDHNFIELNDRLWHLKRKGKLFARAMQVSSWIFQSAGQRDRM